MPLEKTRMGLKPKTTQRMGLMPLEKTKMGLRRKIRQRQNMDGPKPKTWQRIGLRPKMTREWAYCGGPKAQDKT